MKRLHLRLTALLALVSIMGFAVLWAPWAHATATNLISFQGKLTNPDGTNVTDNTYSIVFTIYDGGTATGGGTNVWNETQSVAVSGGLFSVQLGSVNTALASSVNFNHTPLYLAVKVGADAEMSPRVQLTAAPQALNSDLLDGLDSSNFVQLTGGNVNLGAGTVTSGAVNGLTLTQAADGFTVAGGTTARTLTVSGANITIGSTIQPTATGGLLVQSNGAAALTLTSGAAATWSTTSGQLTVQGFGGVALTTPGASGATGAASISTGNSSAGTAGSITIDTGTTATGTPAVNIASANAKAVQIGNNTSNPGVTIDSGSGTINIGTGGQGRSINIGTGAATQTMVIGSATGASALDLQSGTGNLNIMTQGTGGLNVGANAVAQNLTIGNTTGATAVTLQAGTGNLNITTQGTGSLNIGNNAVAQTINIGNGSGATTVSVLCGSGACNFGSNAIAHATTIGSSTGTAATTIQAGSGNLALTSGGNITLGTADGTATLLVLDTRTATGDPTEVDGGMYYNSANNRFRCGQNGTWLNCISGTMATNTAASTAVNTCTTACTAFSTTAALPANYCVPGRLLHIIANGVYSTTASTTLSMGVYTGTNATTKTSDTLIGAASGALSSGAAVTNVGWGVDFYISCFTAGTSGTVNGQGNFSMATSATATAAGGRMYASTTTTINTTTAQTIYLFPAFGASAAGNTATVQQFMVQTL